MTRTISVVALACLSVGCSILAPQPDRSRTFVLTSAPEEGGGRGGGGAALSVGIGPVVVPNYLTRSEIVRRSGENRLVYDQDQLWGEPLEQGFRRVLGEDLGQTLGTVHVFQFPWSTGLRVDYQIPIQILRFEADESGLVMLNVRWGIRRPGENDVLSGQESRIVEAPRDASTGSVVAAMSAAVGRMGDEIATAIRRVAPAGRRPR
jgi:uncharacterized protein